MLNTPEKNGIVRVFKVSSKLIGMICNIEKGGKLIFGSSPSHVQRSLRASYGKA